MLLDAEDLFI